jgi:hypothetical protein
MKLKILGLSIKSVISHFVQLLYFRHSKLSDLINTGYFCIFKSVSKAIFYLQKPLIIYLQSCHITNFYL